MRTVAQDTACWRRGRVAHRRRVGGCRGDGGSRAKPAARRRCRAAGQFRARSSRCSRRGARAAATARVRLVVSAAAAAVKRGFLQRSGQLVGQFVFEPRHQDRRGARQVRSNINKSRTTPPRTRPSPRRRRSRTPPPRPSTRSRARPTATKDAATAIVRLPSTTRAGSARALRAGAERRAGLPGGGGQCLPRQGLCQRPASPLRCARPVVLSGREPEEGECRGRDGGAARLANRRHPLAFANRVRKNVSQPTPAIKQSARRPFPP